MRGLAAAPETRCFFSNGEFQYAVANSQHRPGRPFELTSCPEASSSATLPAKYRRRSLFDALSSGPSERVSSGIALDARRRRRYWRPHAALAARVVAEVLPALTAFDGSPLTHRVPWLVRVDVGTHAAGDLVNGCAADAPESAKRKRVCFLNEVEIVPTLYLAAKFKHSTDFLAKYARNFLRTAFEVAGRPFPQPDEPRAPPAARSPAPVATKHNVALAAGAH